MRLLGLIKEGHQYEKRAHDWSVMPEFDRLFIRCGRRWRIKWRRHWRGNRCKILILESISQAKSIAHCNAFNV